MNYATNVPRDVMVKLKMEQTAFYNNAVESVKKKLEKKDLKSRQ